MVNNVVVPVRVLPIDCYWISQPLQQLKSGDLGDGSRQSRLQRRCQFCKLGAKKRRDLQVFARAGIGNKTISTNFNKLVPSPSENWFRGMSVGESFRRV